MRLADTSRMWRRLLAAAALAVIGAAVSIHAQRQVVESIQTDEGRNFDARIGLASPELTGVSGPQESRIAALRGELPELHATFDPATGVTRTLWNRVGYLTGPDPRAPREIAASYAAAEVDTLGLVPGDVVDMEITDVVFSRVTGATHIYYRQRIGGIAVYNSQLQVNVNRDGRIVSVNNSFLPDLAQAYNALQPSLAAAEAVRAAAEQLKIDNAQLREISSPASGPQRETRLLAENVSTEPVTARLMLLPIRRGEARLVWNFQIYTLDSEHAYDFTVDADSRQVWTRFDWVASDQYTVYASPGESPNHISPPPPADGRTTVPNPAHVVASPFGWHDTNGIAGAEFTIMRGNNVHAYEDSAAVNAPPASQPSCGSSLDCTFGLDLTQAPSTYRPAAIANLFYWNNVIHDIQYLYGFDEPAGNFQVNNYGRSGFQNDDVRAEAQDGGGINNANFFTPADGLRPRMQMYLWNTASPQRDGDFDNGIVVHEYGHGISNRLVGGPSNVSCLGNRQQPGEGLSDWWTLVYTARAADTGPARRGMGTYALNQPTSGNGVRGVPYTTDTSINSWTYASLNGRAVPHGVGAVWAQGMWRVYWALVNQHGFGDLYVPSGGAGNQRAMLYVNEGLKNTPCSPDFTQVRDGIIQAAVDNYGGADVCRMWNAFAAFGLGVDAVSGGPNNTTTVANGFSIPASCNPPLPTISIQDVTVTEGNNGNDPFAAFTISLSAAHTSEVRVTYASSDGTATTSDYSAVMNQAVFSPGVTTRTVNVRIFADGQREPNETFFVNLSGPVGATIADSQAIGTIINDDPLSAPLLRFPMTRVATPTPTYSWEAVEDATWYQLWVNDSSGNRIQSWYTAEQTGCATGGTCWTTPSVSLNYGNVWWWVRAWNATDGYGTWSAVRTFSVGEPAAPTLTGPMQTIQTSVPTYAWDAVASATWYYLYVDDSSGHRLHQWFTAAEANCPLGAGTCDVTPPVALTAGSARFWVQAWSPLGYGAWSRPLFFTVAPSITVAETWRVNGGAPGATVRLWARVRNDTSSAIPGDYRVWLMVTLPGGTTTGIGSVDVSGLAAGANNWYYVDWAIPSDAVGGNYRYRAQVWEGGTTRSLPGAPRNFTVGFDTPFSTPDIAPWAATSGTWANDSQQYLTAPGRDNASQHAVYGSPVNTFRSIDYTVRMWRTGCQTCANRVIVRGTVDPARSSGEWHSGYVFQYAANGTYSVHKYVGGVATVLQGWTSSSAIQTGEAWNVLKVVAHGGSLSFSINGTLVWSGSDDDLPEGRIGAGFQSVAAAGNRLWVDYAIVVDPAFPSSGETASPRR